MLLAETSLSCIRSNSGAELDGVYSMRQTAVVAALVRSPVECPARWDEALRRRRAQKIGDSRNALNIAREATRLKSVIGGPS